MIQIDLKNKYCSLIDELRTINEIMCWLFGVMVDYPEQELGLDGFVIARGNSGRTSALLICTNKSEPMLVKVLNQPPEEYKEKYIAKIVNSETDPVQEVNETSEEQDDEKVVEKG